VVCFFCKIQCGIVLCYHRVQYYSDVYFLSVFFNLLFEGEPFATIFTDHRYSYDNLCIGTVA